MMDKPTLRSSSLPLFMVCSNAVLNPDQLQRVEQENETALLGTLEHKVVQHIAMTGEDILPSLRQRLNNADYDRAGMLTSNFLKVYAVAKAYMPNPRAEVQFTAEMSHLILTGNIDLVEIGGKEAYILDYKTGRQHEDHYHQMMGYAYGAWHEAGRPRVYTVYVTTVYLEDLSITPYTVTTSDLAEWEEEVAKQVMQPRYTAGRKCAFCTLQDTCPAYRVYATNAMKILGDLQEPLPAWETMSPGERGGIMDRVYVMEKAIDRVKSSLRNTVRREGSLDVGGGKQYTIVEEVSNILDPVKAAGVLRTRLGPKVLQSIQRLPIDAVLTAFSMKAAKGQKMKARKELFEELKAAGAISRVVTSKMYRRPIGEKTMEV